MTEQTSAPEAGIRDPRWLLGLAAGSVAIGLVALGGGPLLHLLGYVFASLLAFSLIALYRRRSLDRAVTAGIAAPHWLNLLAGAVVGIGFAVSVAHAWFIASYLS